MMTENTKDKQLIHTINKKEYLLVEIPVIGAENVESQLEKFLDIGAIYQSMHIDRGGILTNNIVTVRFLIPTKNINKYIKMINKKAK